MQKNRKRRKGHNNATYADNLFLPFALLLANTFLPLAVSILFLNPCTFALDLFLGWNVIFITQTPPSQYISKTDCLASLFCFLPLHRQITQTANSVFFISNDITLYSTIIFFFRQEIFMVPSLPFPGCFSAPDDTEKESLKISGFLFLFPV